MGDLMSMGDQSNNLVDMFGNNSMGGGDLLNMGGSSAPMGNLFGSSASFFPSFIAYEDNSIQIGFVAERESGNNFNVTAHYRNKTGFNIQNINMQVAVQKYMTLKMKPSTGTSLQPNASDLTQKM